MLKPPGVGAGSALRISAALHARAADDRVAPVVEAHPGLAAAVIVRRPDDQGRVLAGDTHALRSLRLDTPPDSDERVLLPLTADRRLVGVAREDSGLRWQLHQDVHYRLPHLFEVPAPDRILEERVACEDGLAVDDERDHVVGVAGRCQRLHSQATHLGGTGLDRQAELALVLDMVGMRMGPQDDLRLDPPVLRRLLQRLERRSGIDVQGGPALLICNEVGVREVARMQAPFDEHGGTLPAYLRRGGTEMGLLGRAGEIIRAKFSALLNRAENPNETLDYSYEKQLQSLQNVKRGVADVVTAKKRLEIQTKQLEQNVVTLDTQARQALGAGREDLARQALERKSGIQQQLQDLDTQVKQLQDQQDKLVASEKQLSAKVEQFRSQKEVIKAQYSAAEAQVRIGEAATGIGREMDNTGLAIQRAKDKTEQMQARASAIDELVTSGDLEELGSTTTQLDRELSQLASQQQVDRELEQMKVEVGSGGDKKEIEGAPPSS
jgi:phage shock protein A